MQDEYEPILMCLKQKECTLDEIMKSTGLKRSSVLCGIDHLTSKYPLYEDSKRHITYYGLLK